MYFKDIETDREAMKAYNDRLKKQAAERRSANAARKKQRSS